MAQSGFTMEKTMETTIYRVTQGYFGIYRIQEVGSFCP